MPVVLVLGANGFLGRHLVQALRLAGQTVISGARPEASFAQLERSGAWEERLRGADVVVNATGIFRQSRGNTFATVHVNGPRSVFRACAKLGLKVVQISALGADGQAETAFHRTKKQADDELLALPVPSVVIQPSLVYGPGGASARLFSALATLPLIPLPGNGGQRIQPVHVKDLCDAVVAIVRRDYYPRTRLPVVGPTPTTLREFLADLRAALGLGAARFVNVPPCPVRAFARACGKLDIPFDTSALSMLERGNVGDPAPLRDLLGHAPRPSREFIDTEIAQSARAAATLAWLLPILRVAVAAVWIVAGIVSLGLYPVADSLTLLERAHLTGPPAFAALYGAAVLDLALGAATLIVRRRLLWLIQIAVIAIYSAIITAAIPELWLHPFGPIAKNLPLLAALLLLYQLEER